MYTALEAASIDEKMAPMQGPMRKPMEKAMPTRAMTDERSLFALMSVIMAMQMETFALEMPPMMRLMRKTRKTLDIDQVMCEMSVPTCLSNVYDMKAN